MATGDGTLLRQEDLRLFLPGQDDVALTEADFATGRYFKANCAGTDLVGDFVRVTGETGGDADVEKVDVTDPLKMPAIGVINNKLTTTTCVVVCIGELDGTGLVAGQTYYVGTDARIAASAPTPVPPAPAVTQDIGIALTSTRIFLRLSLPRIKRDP